MKSKIFQLSCPKQQNIDHLALTGETLPDLFNLYPRGYYYLQHWRQMTDRETGNLLINFKVSAFEENVFLYICRRSLIL